VDTGYFLRDRHSSVTALVDATAAVTDTYAYSDYGAAVASDGQLLPGAATAPDPGGRTNPFRYTGASPRSSVTDATTGLLLLPARSYDSGQGRFTSRDTANVFNHYQAFSTNPIINTDPTGHFSLADLLIDIGTVIAFIVATVATTGAAVAALPAVLGLEAGAATVSTIAFTVATAAGAVASATGAVTSVVKMGDDINDAVNHKHFLSKSARSALGTVQIVAGAVAGVAGLGALGETLAGAGADVAESAVQDASAFLDPEDEAEPAGARAGDSEPRLFATVADESEVDSVESLVDGPSSRASETESVTPSTSRSLTARDILLRNAIGGDNLGDGDAAVMRVDSGLDTSMKADHYIESDSWSGHSELSRSETTGGGPTGIDNPYTRDATEGDWDVDTEVRYGQEIYIDKEYINLRHAMLGSDVDAWANGGLLVHRD